MFDQLVRSKALQNTFWIAHTKTARELTFEQFPSEYRPLLQRWAFDHQHSMSNHPESHNYTLQLARSPLVSFEPEFDFSLIPHCTHIHTSTPCRGVQIHPQQGQRTQLLRSYSWQPVCQGQQHLQPKCLGPFFLPVGLFHFKHNVLLPLCFNTQYSIQRNAKSRNSQWQILSGGKTAGQDTSPEVSQCSQHINVHHLSTFLTTFSDIAGLGHAFNPWALTLLQRVAGSKCSVHGTRQGPLPSRTSHLHFFCHLLHFFPPPCPLEREIHTASHPLPEVYLLVSAGYPTSSPSFSVTSPICPRT